MNQYIKADGLVFPITDTEIRRENKGTSFPAEMTDENRAAFGVFPCALDDVPPYDAATQVAEQVAPALIDGAWSIGWTVRDKTPGESAAILAAEREAMTCTPMQGKLALGETNWAVILEYKATAGWAQQTVIDSAQTWVRTSQNIAFFQYLLGFTDAQVDDLFRAAMLIDA